MPSTWALPRARQLQLSCACVPWARARAPYVYCTGLQTLAGGIYVCLRVCALGPRALFPSPLRSGRPSNWNPRRKESPSSWVRARALSLSRAIRVQIPATVDTGARAPGSLFVRSSVGLAFCALSANESRRGLPFFGAILRSGFRSCQWWRSLHFLCAPATRVPRVLKAPRAASLGRTTVCGHAATNRAPFQCSNFRSVQKSANSFAILRERSIGERGNKTVYCN